MPSSEIKIEQYIREEVLKLPQYEPGLTTDFVKEKYKLKHITKLASNENPFGISKKTAEIIAQFSCNLGNYSDPSSTQLRNALGEKLFIPPGQIVVGNGSEELIDIVSRVCLTPGDKVLTVSPSFLLHEIYAQAIGARIDTVPMTNQLLFDTEKIISALDRDYKMLIFSTPSNPVGTIINKQDFRRICRAIPAKTILVVDEAYYEYAAGDDDYPDIITELKEAAFPYVILRTFSKAYGLAGVRIGYGIVSEPDFTNNIDKLRTPFNVNAVAQIAAVSALKDDEHLNRSVIHNSKERTRMHKALRDMGFITTDSRANFIFFDVGCNSNKVAQELLQKGIIVKAWKTEGYNQFLRVSVGSGSDNSHFLDAISTYA